MNNDKTTVLYTLYTQKLTDYSVSIGWVPYQCENFRTLILFAYVYSALSDVRRTVRDVKMAILEALSNNASVVPSLQIGMIGSLVAMLQHVRPNPAKSKCVLYYVKYTSTIFTSIKPENTNTQSIGTLMI